MAWVTKVVKHGNSQCIVIPKPILELLGWDKDTLLRLRTPDGRRIVVSKEKEAECQKTAK